MEFVDGILKIDQFMTVTFGIVVLFIGKRLNLAVRFLKEFSIPEPVSGGIVASLILTLLYALFELNVAFDLGFRDILLTYFFITIGINASVKDLAAGGKPLMILLAITIAYMFLQNFIGVTIASLFGLPSAMGVASGTVSLIGGHGTAIAWAPKLAADYGAPNAMEVGIACATFGLILASLQGGPLASFLIKRYNLKPTSGGPISVGVSTEEKAPNIGPYEFLDAILAIHLCMFLGYFFNIAVLQKMGFDLPYFVTCLFAGIVMSNLVPKSWPRISGQTWPSRTPVMALIAEISLGAFLSMSLMSMQLWTLLDLAGPIIAVLAAQVIFVMLVAVFILFPAMGRNYDAAVICSGFGGFSLGATPTAMANMSAVTQRFGPSHMAFIVVPLVGAFFIDLANALIIPLFLRWFS